nr:glycosyltransferase 87 family protein [Bryobacter sp.]
MRERLEIALGVGAILLLWTLIGSHIVGHAQRHDFLNLYTGGLLAGEGRWEQLHDPAVQFAAERRMVPDLPALVPFVRPHFYAWLLQPLAWLPLGASFWTWLALQAGLYAGWTAWAARRFGGWAVIASAAFAPVVYGVMNGQDCVLMLWIVTGT